MMLHRHFDNSYVKNLTTLKDVTPQDEEPLSYVSDPSPEITSETIESEPIRRRGRPRRATGL